MKRVLVAISILLALMVGMAMGIRLTINSAVLIENSDYHYAIGYLSNYYEVYYTY